MTTRIQVYTVVDVCKKDGYRLVATNGVQGWYLVYDKEFPDTWSIELIPALIDAVTVLRSGEAWHLGSEEFVNLVYEVDIKSHPEFFL